MCNGKTLEGLSHNITSLLCDKKRETELPEQAIALIEFMEKTLLSAYLMEGNCVMNGMLRMECDREVFHLEYYLISIMMNNDRIDRLEYLASEEERR